MAAPADSPANLRNKSAYCRPPPRLNSRPGYHSSRRAAAGHVHVGPVFSIYSFCSVKIKYSLQAVLAPAARGRSRGHGKLALHLPTPVKSSISPAFTNSAFCYLRPVVPAPCYPASPSVFPIVSLKSGGKCANRNSANCGQSNQHSTQHLLPRRAVGLR